MGTCYSLEKPITVLDIREKKTDSTFHIKNSLVMSRPIN